MFKALKKIQFGLIEKIKQEETILHCYLYGHTDYFNRELLDTHPLLLEIYEFENKLNIIIELNKKFQFEKDDFFTPKSIAQKIHEDYPKDFDSLLQLQFIEHQILNNKKVNRAYIFSIFYLFKKELSINAPTAKLFGEVINSYFNFDFGELKDNSSTNLEHDKRIEKLKKDWNNFLQ
ncbi:MAG: hypothetical protein V3V28_06490 [Polaribacter sp.]|uniref:hypothetical protein n=1 Tax=Polaribacter sp. TaxID=1920175 RepID=UPI002F36128F